MFPGSVVALRGIHYQKSDFFRFVRDGASPHPRPVGPYRNQALFPAAGSVRLIHVQEGEAVSAGAKLVELEVSLDS